MRHNLGRDGGPLKLKSNKKTNSVSLKLILIIYRILKQIVSQKNNSSHIIKLSLDDGFIFLMTLNNYIIRVELVIFSIKFLIC